ncbi:hypothetical protein [Terriglobus sp. RCC_193]|uniref:hypothetical protein n=1 Tax=Terriglobus sp. RCC_193 TaxID=3239218 RepID=UPI0035245B4E
MNAAGGMDYPARLIATRTGVAPADLLDVQLPSGEVLYWANRRITAPSVIVADGGTAENEYLPWLVGVPEFSLVGNMDADTAQFEVQNVTGNSMQRDFERIMQRNVINGALFVYRLWQAGAESAWLEVHGTFDLGSVGITAELDGKDIVDASSADTPEFNYGEICPLEYGELRCGATDVTPCQNTFPTCRVPERALVVLTDFEKDYSETIADVSTRYVDRRRKF